MFLPYLDGERTPPLPDARGQLVGLTLTNMTPANVARATIEGVLWSLAYGLQVLREQTGSIGRVILTGGASQSEAVRTIAWLSSDCRSLRPRSSRAWPWVRLGRPPGR